jgi:hypothetical protein
MISVMEASGNVSSSLSQVIDQYNEGVVVLSQRHILSENMRGRGCREFKEIVSKESAVPPEDVPGPLRYIINTEFFCEVDKHIYVTVLRNFEDNKKQLVYQWVASQVAESLRENE